MATKSEMGKHRLREMRIEVHRDGTGNITGHTVHHHMEPMMHEGAGKDGGPYMPHDKTEQYPFGAGQHEEMMDHVAEHLDEAE